MGQWMDGYLERMVALDEEALRGGGEERIQVQHGLGKLTARERIDKLVDPGSFKEFGSNVRDPSTRIYSAEPKPSPGDGVVMGTAEVEGRRIMAYALDFTVMSGTIGDQGVWKIAELVQMAGQEQVPIFGILDSAGSRIRERGVRNSWLILVKNWDLARSISWRLSVSLLFSSNWC